MIKLLLIILLSSMNVNAPSPVVVTVTAYCLSENMTASGELVRVGCIALSRDLEHQLGVTFGDEIILKGIGKFVFLDRMHKRWKKRVDIWLPTRNRCMKFGKKVAYLSVKNLSE